MPDNKWTSMRTISEQIDADTMRRALFARMEQMKLAGEQLVEDYRQKMAESFLLAGITLIPSEYLHDHQFVVSRGVYDAALKMASAKKTEI